MYLARQLLEEGHKVTLLTRGKKPGTFQIPDDTDDSYATFQQSVQHIAADRTDEAAVQKGLEGKNFQGKPSNDGRSKERPVAVFRRLLLLSAN